MSCGEKEKDNIEESSFYAFRTKETSWSPISQPHLTAGLIRKATSFLTLQQLTARLTTRFDKRFVPICFFGEGGSRKSVLENATVSRLYSIWQTEHQMSIE